MAVFDGVISAIIGAANAAAGGFKIERSVRFNSADSASLDRTPSSASNRRTWTWSGWVKRAAAGAYDFLFMAQTSGVLKSSLSFWNGDYIRFKGDYNDGTARNFSVSTNALFRDPSAWYHVICRLDTTQATAADRIKIWVNGVEQTFSSATYPTQNSDIEFNNTSGHLLGSQTGAPSNGLDGYLAEVHFVDGQALAATDFGEYDDNNNWNPKEYTGTYGTNGFYLKFDDNSSDAALGTDSSGNNNTWTVNNIIAGNPQVSTSGVTSVGTSGSDTLLTFSDSTNFSYFQAGDVAKSYITQTLVNRSGTVDLSVNNWSNKNFGNCFDGDLDTAGTVNTGASMQATFFMQTSEYIGETDDLWFRPVDGSSPTVRINNQSISMTSAGSDKPSGSNTTGWYKLSRANIPAGATTMESYNCNIPAKAGCTIGSFAVGSRALTEYRFDLAESDIVSIDSNNSQMVVEAGATWSNGDVITKEAVEGDSLIDTPTNYTASSGNNGGNYCTLNPLESALTGINNGNLNSGSSGASSWKICTSTIAISSGKYYWEGFTDTTATSSLGWQWGFCQVGPSSLTTPYGTGKWSYQHNIVYTQSSSGTTVGTTAGANDLLAYALDMDAGTCKLYVNNSLIHTFTGITGTITPFVGSYSTPKVTVNFGQRPFEYTPPTDHLSLCTTNLPNPTIAEGSTAMDVALYTGDGTSNRAITGLGMSPDFVWIKSRSGSTSHVLLDAVRGTDKILVSNSTLDEATVGPSWQAQFGNLDSFDSAGFTVTNGTDSAGNFNSNNVTYVGWAWDGGTSTESNTDGDITSSVRANASAGFSIVSYTGNGTAGATVGHGLNDQLGLLIVKNRSTSTTVAWGVKHSALYSNAGNWLSLNSTQAVTAESAGAGSLFNATNPTSSVFTLGPRDTTNTNGDNYIAYCWAPVAGYSAFGSYTGNGNADGPFVYTGFRPKWILLKESSAAGNNWNMYDTSRNEYNVVDAQLKASSNAAEVTNTFADYLSNGFKIRTSTSGLNTNSETFIYAAFAEHPFKTARAR